MADCGGTKHYPEKKLSHVSRCSVQSDLCPKVADDPDKNFLNLYVLARSKFPLRVLEAFTPLKIKSPVG